MQLTPYGGQSRIYSPGLKKKKKREEEKDICIKERGKCKRVERETSNTCTPPLDTLTATLPHPGTSFLYDR